MTSFFQKKDPICPTVLPPALLQDRSTLSPLISYTRMSQALQNQAEESSQSVSPLSRLWDVSASLPDTIPLAVPSDHIAALTSDPKEMVDIRQLEDPDEDPYEWFNKMLNGICGKYTKWNRIMGLLPTRFWRHTSIT